MIGKPDVASRRILTFPAICPCEAVSPATLLDSLLNLSRNICEYQWKPCYTNNRNARESIRLVRILLDLFDEIRWKRESLSDSVLLCLSELHFIFQRLQFLLEDCARDDARLWMLVKCERVASQFRLLMMAVATALDVLPMCSINVPSEVEETIQLVMRQARRPAFTAGPDDQLASKNVASILSQFEKGIAPELGDLRRILHHLVIRSWSSCNEEIKFLESEIELESSGSAKTDLALLSSLIGFMSYCRGVLYDVVDDVKHRQSKVGFNGEVIRHLNPEDFRCPISLEIMTDPVTIPTGHTYDRSSILKWFSNGSPTCPKTGQRLTSTYLVPNLALKRLIQQYCHENGIHVAETGAKNNLDITRTVLAGSVAADRATTMLASFLTGSLSYGGIRERDKAAYEIRLLTKSSIFNRSCLVEAGAIPHLLDLLHSTDSSAQENAMAALLNLSKHQKSKAVIVHNGGLDSILKVLKEGAKMDARQHAAGALFYLASVEEYRELIGEIPESMPTLAELIKDGTDRCKKNALVTIFGLLMHPSNHRRALSAALVPLLVSLLNSCEKEDLVTVSLAILAALAERLAGTVAVIRAGALQMIVKILSSSTSNTAMKYCVSLLLALCINAGEEVVPFLVKSPSLMDPLYSLLTKGSSRASKKAGTIIRIIHEFQERSSSGFISPVVPREQFVHVW